MTVEAVIFDFGGVIVPGSPSGDAANSPYAAMEERHGLPAGCLWKAIYIENSGWLRLRVGEGSFEDWYEVAHTNIRALCGPAVAEAVLAEIEAARPQGKAARTMAPSFNEGMVELLGRLHGRVRVQLLSNAAPGLEEDLREHYRIDHLFDDIINSATVGLAKPDARIFRLAAERVGVPIERCFFTDDLLHNVEGARAEGMTAHHFITGYAGLRDALVQAGVECD